MDALLIAIILFLTATALAVLSNHARSRNIKSLIVDLEPNCLLTRWPLLFVTGPRSLFYFNCYWNSYTSYLAEHGYEVYNLRLPWNNTKLRKHRFQDFLQEQEHQKQKFHLFVDSHTLKEFNEILELGPTGSIMSLTEITEARKKLPTKFASYPFPTAIIECRKVKSSLITKSDFLNRMAYFFHTLLLAEKSLPSIYTLGACPFSACDNSKKLLERSKSLGETDFCT